MKVSLLDINALVVLNAWAVENGYSAPLYDPDDSTVIVGGAETADVAAFLASISSEMIEQAKVTAFIVGFQMRYPKPTNATLVQQVQWAKLIADKVIEHLRTAATGGADAVTLSGWVDKLAVANLVKASDATAIAIIQAEADMRGQDETADQLADSIIAKGALLRLIRSKIDGFENKLLKDLQGVTDVPSYEAVVTALVTEGSTIINELGV